MKIESHGDVGETRDVSWTRFAWFQSAASKRVRRVHQFANEPGPLG